jgi:hypothetical protein
MLNLFQHPSRLVNYFIVTTVSHIVDPNISAFICVKKRWLDVHF